MFNNNMLKKILKILEDPFRPLLGPNVKALKLWGMLLPENFYKKCFYIFLHIMQSVLVVTQLMEIWFVKSDINLFLDNIEVTIVSAVTVFKMATFIFWQKHWISIIDYVTAADIENRKTTNPQNVATINKFTRYCRRIAFIYWSIIYTSGTILISHPFIKFVSLPIYRQNARNSTETYLPVFSSWVPFDKNSPLGYLAASVYQSFGVIGVCGWITSFDSFTVTNMVFFKGEIELLRNDSSSIFGTTSDPVTDEEAVGRIKSCHQRHVLLTQYAKLFNSCLSPVMFVYVLLCSIVFCVTAYKFNIETSAMQRIIISEYMVSNVAQLFVFCWHANDVFYASTCLMHGPYESVWWTRSVKLKRNVLMLTTQFKTLIIFSASPFTNLTLATFINILKGAYSYYTLLSQSQT